MLHAVHTTVACTSLGGAPHRVLVLASHKFTLQMAPAPAIPGPMLHAALDPEPAAMCSMGCRLVEAGTTRSTGPEMGTTCSGSSGGGGVQFVSPVWPMDWPLATHPPTGPNEFATHDLNYLKKLSPLFPLHQPQIAHKKPVPPREKIVLLSNFSFY